VSNTNKELTFTTLAELKGFLCGLDESELKAATNTHDWYVIDVVDGFNRSKYYTIEGYNGGDE